MFARGQGFRLVAAFEMQIQLVITAPAELWFFDGENPGRYLVLGQASVNSRDDNVVWTADPPGAVEFTDPRRSRTSITATQPSRQPADISIVCTHFAAAGFRDGVARYAITVRAPAALLPLRTTHSGSLVYGYESHVHYSVVDQFGQVLPHILVPINERFITPQVADRPGVNWVQAVEGGVLVYPSDWFDMIQGQRIPNLPPPSPRPVDPRHLSAGEAVCHWTGEWRVGSKSVGLGTLVRTGVIWSKKKGFAVHG